MEIKKQELAIIEGKVKNAVAEIEKVSIKTDEDLSAAATILTNVKKLQKFVTQEKEKILKPLRESTSAVRGLFAPLEDQIDGAESKLRIAMSSYQTKKEKVIEKKQESVAKRVESGQLKEETGIRKLEEIGEAKTTVRTEEGAVSFRNVRKVRFAPLDTLPADILTTLVSQKFIVWDEALARKAALAGLLGVGVEVYEEKEVATRV